MITSTYSETTALCVRSMRLMTEGSREDFDRVLHPEAVNREAAVEPPATRETGPAGFWATAQWLRAAFSGLRFEIHEAAAQEDLVVLHVPCPVGTPVTSSTTGRVPPTRTRSCHRPGRNSPSRRPTGSAPGTA
jgi:hypothetical protein